MVLNLTFINILFCFRIVILSDLQLQRSRGYIVGGEMLTLLSVKNIF